MLGTGTRWVGQKKKRKRRTGWKAEEEAERTRRTPQKQMGACRQHDISIFGGWLSIRKREPASHRQLPKPWPRCSQGDSQGGGQSWHQGNGFQKEQEIVAGKKASTPPTADHHPSPPSNPGRPFCFLTPLFPSPGLAAFSIQQPQFGKLSSRELGT